ncbi:MAG: hypothetical protein OQK98_11375 [Gammaproteobacteria bacterium]|nr:hypothetical protein [Gammaproteobacteria bacterium]
MADLESNIPTLTDISHQGNAEMLNHFDGHQFDKETDDTDSIVTLENASKFENENIITDAALLKNEQLEEIPSIKIEESINSDIELENFSDAMLSIKNKPIDNEHNNKELKEKIDLAIKNALSGIELQLKEQLYKEFGI